MLSQNIWLDVLCKELRITANCVHIRVKSPFFVQRCNKKGVFFMKNKKSFVAIAVLLVLVAVAAVCWFAFSPETVEGGKSITVDITHGDGSTKTFQIHTDAEFLRGALEQEDLVDGLDGEYGMYILTMDGETVDESNQEWWGYTKSGEQVNYGIDTCPIADGDHFEFTFNVGW